jgi:hypothetical protein
MQKVLIGACITLERAPGKSCRLNLSRLNSDQSFLPGPPGRKLLMPQELPDQ